MKGKQNGVRWERTLERENNERHAEIKKAEAAILRPFRICRTSITSRKIRMPSMKYRCHQAFHADGLSCARRCGLTRESRDNLWSCLCPSHFFGPPFSQFFRLHS